MHFRRVTSQDLPLLIELAHDESYDEFFRRTPPTCEWSHPNLVESTFANYYFMVKDGKEIGLASMGIEDPFAKVFKVGGLMIKGHTMEESKLMLDYMVDLAFNKLSMNKIVTLILSHRTKLHERFLKYGFRLEGVFKESALHRGKLVDEHQYALRREEWQAYSVQQRQP